MVPGKPTRCVHPINSPLRLGVFDRQDPTRHCITDHSHAAASISQHMSFCNKCTCRVSVQTEAKLIELWYFQTREKARVFPRRKSQYSCIPTKLFHCFQLSSFTSIEGNKILKFRQNDICALSNRLTLSVVCEKSTFMEHCLQFCHYCHFSHLAHGANYRPSKY